MYQPTVCHIFESITGNSAIAKAAMWGVRQALAAGWKVTVVTKELDRSLQGEVEWLRLAGPSRLFFLQWVTARAMVRRALGSRTFDVVHAHQAQICALSDVMQCHFLTRVAFERKCLENRRAPRPAFVRLQQQGVLYAEDYYYQRLHPETRMLFDSHLLEVEFHRLYGRPAQSDILTLPVPATHFATADERREARAKWVGDEFRGLVVGFLGGIVEHKGWRRLCDAVSQAEDLFLLLGGPDTDRFEDPRLKGRSRGVGYVRDAKSFYAACDAFVVPSLFEPLGTVAFDVVARGVPVIATREVGALAHLQEFGAGLEWVASAPLAPIVREAARRREEFNRGGERLAEALSSSRQGKHLICTYEAVLDRKHAARSAREHAMPKKRQACPLE